MDYPRLTIATVNRNYGRFLSQAIESVLSQSYPNLEYIVLDAASTDDSPAIIRRFADRLDFWRSAPDGGPAAALNEALDRASGEWFYYLNSDDLLLPGALEAFAGVVRGANPQTWLSGGRHDIDADGRFLRVVMPWRQQQSLFAIRRMHHIAEGTFLNVGYLRREGLRFDESYFNIFDTVLYTQLDRRGPPVYVDFCFGAMRWHGANKSGPGNLDSVRREGERFAAQMPRPSAARRLLRRAQITRLSAAVDRSLAALFRAGVLGRRDIVAAVADGAGNFRAVPVRGVVR
jgi:glycosyltransferase involved in cell wall biosynthesis